MRIVDRYLIKEILPTFVLGIAVFTVVFLMSQFLRLVELIINKGVGLGEAGKLIVYLLPSVLVLTIPIAMLLGAITTFGRMTADNEITALLTGGYSLVRLALPVFFFAVFSYGLTAWAITTALPWGNQAFRGLMFDIVRSKASIGLRERVFNDDFDGLVMYINDIPVSDSPVMKGIMIHDYRGENDTPPREPTTIFAEQGQLVYDSRSRAVIFRLRDGSIHSMNRDQKRYEQIDFKFHDLRLTMAEGLIGGENLPKGLREMTIAELRQKVEEYRKEGIPVYPPLVEIHKKFAIPFACFVFAFLGISLGVLTKRGGKMVGFAISVAVVIVYYVLLVGGEPVGKQGVLPPWLAMWGANIFFSLLTVTLFWKTAFERFPAEALVRWALDFLPGKESAS